MQRAPSPLPPCFVKLFLISLLRNGVLQERILKELKSRVLIFLREGLVSVEDKGVTGAIFARV